MADPLENPLVAFKFGLEIEGKMAGYFTNVGGIGSESEVVEHKVVNSETGETIIQKIPGRLTWTEVTLKRGVTSNIDVWQWRQSVVEGKVEEARTNCSIIAYNQANEPMARWNFIAAWPSKVTGPDLDSGSAEYMVEEMIIVHEGMWRES
ncbi:MAG: phage tail protein [Anaerolineales bacterium]|nr:phage tail protein [Anaerolineales bacterium]